MAVEVKEPASLEVYVDADGKLTREGLKLLQQMVRAIKDHETRIVVLEP